MRGSVCLRLMPLTRTSAIGFTPRSIRPHRIAQLKITAMTLRMLPLVFGASSRDFNHCSIVNGTPFLANLRRGQAAHFGRMWVSNVGSVRQIRGVTLWHFLRDITIQ